MMHLSQNIFRNELDFRISDERNVIDGIEDIIDHHGAS